MSCSLSVSATVLQEWKQFWPTWTKPTNTYFSQSTQGLSVHWGENGKLTSSSSRLDINQLVCGLCASWTCCFRLVTVETTVWNSNCVENNTWPQSLCIPLCQGRLKHPSTANSSLNLLARLHMAMEMHMRSRAPKHCVCKRCKASQENYKSSKGSKKQS